MQVPIYPALTRPVLLMGAEREPLLLNGMFCAMLVFATQSLPAVVLGIGLWLAGLYALQQMAKADPYMLQVYLRHVRYQAFYPARARVWRER